MGDESLAPEKLCNLLLGTGKLKITMKHHVACCKCYCSKIAQATCARVPLNFRLRAADCICLV